MATSPLERLLARYPADVQALARAARTTIGEQLPKVEESLDEPGGLVGFGYGPDYKGLLCTLILSKTGVKLGFAYGAQLPDPERLLEGSGKVHRFVALRSAADLRQAGLAALFKAARAAWQDRVGQGPTPAQKKRTPRAAAR